jgi:hypothetical protein
MSAFPIQGAKMGNVIQGKKTSDSNWALFPMLVIAAVLVIVLSALSVMALNGMMRSEQSNVLQHLEPLPEMQRQSVPQSPDSARRGFARIDAGTCDDCGVADATNAAAVKGGRMAQGS